MLAAINRPLEHLLREGRFRPDLYYRLDVIQIEIPPLRELQENIVLLVDLLLERAASEGSVVGVSAAALGQLVAYP